MTIPEKTIYLKDSLNSRPETVNALFLAVQQLTDALRAGKWPKELISKDLRDRSGELIPAMIERFRMVEDFEVVGIYDTGGYYAVDATAVIDDQTVRIGMVLRQEESVIRLVATPLIGAAIQ